LKRRLYRRWVKPRRIFRSSRKMTLRVGRPSKADGGPGVKMRTPGARKPPEPDQMLPAIHSFRRPFGSAPTWVAAGLPSLNRISVGMPRTA